MSVKSGQAVTVLFSTANASTGAATDATGTPAGTLYVNGTANGAAVTVTNITTGLYKAAVTLPSLTAGDVVSIRISATVSAVAGEGVIWQEVADTKRVSDLNDFDPANDTVGLVTTVTSVANGVTLADGAITAAKFDASTAFPLTAADSGSTYVARTGADGDTLETLSDQLDAIDVNGTAAAVWAYTPRTLTQTAAAVASVMAGTSLTITRGDTLSATLTGLGNITGYANLWFTVKWATSDLDAAAIIQIDTDTGLLTVNGAAATAGNGSITVDDATAGDITIALEASVTDDLTPATGLVYDVQWQSGTSIYTLTSGVAVVSADVTRAVA